MIATMRYALAIIGLITFVEGARCQTYDGPVGTVIDGDSITIRRPSGGEIEFRLCGVDAPEKWHRGGSAATQALKNMIDGKDIRCIQVRKDAGTPCDGLSKPTNRGRIVAQCFIDNKDIAEEMVRLKHACDWPKFSGGYYQRKVPGACVTNR